jgi:hypothetical protein
LNGAVYQYFDVPPHVAEELDALRLGAGSIGRYLQERIRGVFRFARI